MQRFMTRKVLISSALALWLLGSLSGCNTISGVGKDVQQGGQALEEAAS